MKSYYADLHIHIGRTEQGNHVKISGSKDLTFANIAHEAACRKGMDLIGIIDCHAPSVQTDIIRCLSNGEMQELSGGGIQYRGTTILLGTELEIREPGRGAAHVLIYMRTLADMQQFTEWMRPRMKNIELSSQRIYVEVQELQAEVMQRGGIFIPAHIFTPHKGIYGASAPRMAELLNLDQIAGVELGLSADSEMAGFISELDRYTFLTNSDAHSLGKIAREYNTLQLAAASFDEFVLALRREAGRQVTANYGLNPRLGKYHRTFCQACDSIIDETYSTELRCPYCGSTRIVHGVMDRIHQIADREQAAIPAHRPPYYYQVPLDFLPGLGPKKRNALLSQFGTEMNILHRASQAELAAIVGEGLAEQIMRARSGQLGIVAGGGGTYGKIR